MAPTNAPARERAVERKKAPPSLKALSVAVDGLAAGLDANAEKHVAAALDAVALALADTDTAAKERKPGSVTSADMVRALEAALSTLGGRIDASPAPRAHAAFTRAGAALERLSPSRSLDDQRPEILATFQAITTALAVSMTVELPGYELRYETAQRSETAARDAIAKADAMVAAAAVATDWKTARTATAESLELLGDFFDTVPVDGREAERELAAATLSARYDAARLRHAATVEFGKAEWVRHALVTFVETAEDRFPGGTFSAALLRRARGSSKMISTAHSIVFQRAAIQDAMRAMTSALMTLQLAALPAR